VSMRVCLCMPCMIGTCMGTLCPCMCQSPPQRPHTPHARTRALMPTHAHACTHTRSHTPHTTLFQWATLGGLFRSSSVLAYKDAQLLGSPAWVDRCRCLLCRRSATRSPALGSMRGGRCQRTV
jgi:hypothetical protein